MEVKLSNESHSDAKWVNNPLFKLPELSEYLEENCKFDSNFSPNQSPNGNKLKEKPNASKRFAQIGSDFSGILYGSFHMKVPANLASIDYVMKRLSSHRRTRSINDLSNHFINPSLSNYTREIDRCTSERWVFESKERPIISKKLPNNPSYFSKFSPKLGVKSIGILRNKLKDGLPSFEFSIKGKGGEFYVANPIKVNNLSTKGLDCIYLFHKGVTRKKGLEFVGMMKVSSSLVLNPNGYNYIETEFVLFSDNMQSEFSNPKNRGLLGKKALQILRPNYIFNKSKTIKGGKISESSVLDESLFINYLSHDFPSNYESCAIVVRNYRYENNKHSVSGGWGLKFLKKEEIGEKYREKYNKEGKFRMDLNVLIPNGVHTIIENRVPSSIIERWRSNGLCDCGGWDLGCPISVICTNNLPKAETVDPNFVDLYVKGLRNEDSVLRLVHASEGVNVVYFEPNLSALQCFSIGMAFVHAQTPDLSPNL